NWLSRAWALINTSIHEESPVSVFEALSCGTPVVSMEDWGGMVSDFGIHVQHHGGSGMGGIDGFVQAVEHLMSSVNDREVWGRMGRQWVLENHGDERFVTALKTILRN